LKEIVAKAKRGDEEAFTVLYEFYFAPIYRYVFTHIGSKIDADDLTQDIFVKILESFSRYEETSSPPLAFFYTIARNTVIDWHRKKKTQPLDEGIENILRDPALDPEAEAIGGEEQKEILSLVSRLSPDQRDAIILKYVNDMSNKEIAEIMGKSEETVRKIQSRGFAVLRTMIKKGDLKK